MYPPAHPSIFLSIDREGNGSRSCALTLLEFRKLEELRWPRTRGDTARQVGVKPRESGTQSQAERLRVGVRALTDQMQWVSWPQGSAD